MVFYPIKNKTKTEKNSVTKPFNETKELNLINKMEKTIKNYAKTKEKNNIKLNNSFFKNFITYKKDNTSKKYSEINKKTEKILVLRLLKFLIVLNILYPILSKYSITFETLNYRFIDDFFPIMYVKNINRPDNIYINDAEIPDEYINYSDDYLKIKIPNGFNIIKLVWNRVIPQDYLPNGRILNEIDSNDILPNINENEINSNDISSNDDIINTNNIITNNINPNIYEQEQVNSIKTEEVQKETTINNPILEENQEETIISNSETEGIKKEAIISNSINTPMTLSQIPEVYIEIIPTTIQTTIPTTIQTTIPTTIQTTIPTTIQTTIQFQPKFKLQFQPKFKLQLQLNHQLQ